METSEIVVIGVTAFFFLFLLVKPHLSKVGFNPIEGVRISSGFDLFMRYLSAIVAFSWYPIIFFYFYYIWHDIIWVPVVEGSFRWLILAILGILFAGWAINEFNRAGWRRMKWSLILMVSVLIVSEVVRYHFFKDDPPPKKDKEKSGFVYIPPPVNNQVAPQKPEKEKPKPKKVVEIEVPKTIYVLLERNVYNIAPGDSVFDNARVDAPDIYADGVAFYSSDSVRIIALCGYPESRARPYINNVGPEREPTEEEMLQGEPKCDQSLNCPGGIMGAWIKNAFRDEAVQVVVHCYKTKTVKIKKEVIL